MYGENRYEDTSRRNVIKSGAVSAIGLTGIIASTKPTKADPERVFDDYQYRDVSLGSCPLIYTPGDLDVRAVGADFVLSSYQTSLSRRTLVGAVGAALGKLGGPLGTAAGVIAGAVIGTELHSNLGPRDSFSVVLIDDETTYPVPTYVASTLGHDGTVNIPYPNLKGGSYIWPGIQGLPSPNEWGDGEWVEQQEVRGETIFNSDANIDLPVPSYSLPSPPVRLEVHPDIG